MQIPRFYQQLNNYLKPNKALIIYGPRQVGKTTLLTEFLSNCGFKYKLDNGDNITTRHILSSQDFDQIKEYTSGYELIAIDEAQKIPNIGVGLKIMIDQISGLRIIATGSSSFSLAGQIGEPLTGRKATITLYPISQIELKNLYNSYELKNKLSEYLIFGSYPEVATEAKKQDKIQLLAEIVDSYLLKDILELEKIKNSKIVLDLLRLLAFQISSEVSYTELGGHLGIDYKTVVRYLDLLEKSFVIYNLRGFSRNLRQEITKKSKYYFYDIGIRNAIISNFNNLELRNDIGALWENFLMMERLKKRAYEKILANNYFWRTYNQQEIDLVEEREGKLYGYEFKWGERKIKEPKEWRATYKNAEFAVINQENYLEFIS